MPEICSKHLTIMGFFADWCPHCVKFHPEFKKAMSEQPKDVHWHIFKDNTREGKLAMKKYNITGFPTVLIYLPHQDRLVKYTGPRTSAGLTTFITDYNRTNV